VFGDDVSERVPVARVRARSVETRVTTALARAVSMWYWCYSWFLHNIESNDAHINDIVFLQCVKHERVNELMMTMKISLRLLIGFTLW